ncbi:ABC transporter permease subunit [Halovenus sp. WSH3]|uniref:ABC transporter permease subunit n=1 Tax=Halovenus carboxidivorans TaxID=2692199 RepID=A0A6B0SZJ4_9EURY|nr:ABC transporter permease subunit [Halovenus carboxidivorans]MXR50935.1 ABC transporter permease subunit [Halovenus carboxidivorans]
MTWQAVAYKDFQDAIRSRMLLVLTALFALFVGLAAFAYSELSGGDPSGGGLLWALWGPSALLVPIIAILVSYRSVAGERELGSMRFLLALPHTRRAVVFGKVLGRTAVVAVAVLAGFAIGGAIIYVSYELSPFAYLGFVAGTILLGLVYVSVGVGVSAVTGSVSRAAALVVGLFVFVQYLWSYFWLLVVYVTNGFEVPGFEEFPAWFDVAAALGPGVAYNELMVSIANRDPNSDIIFAGQLDDAAIQLPDWYPLFVFAGWTVVTLGIGYWRFERADLT